MHHIPNPAVLSMSSILFSASALFLLQFVSGAVAWAEGKSSVRASLVGSQIQWAGVSGETTNWGAAGDIALAPADEDGDGVADLRVAKVQGDTVSVVSRLSAGGSSVRLLNDSEGVTTLDGETLTPSTLAKSAPKKEVIVSGFTCDRRLSNRDGTGGFVNNPHNSKGKVKAVLPRSYTGSIKSVKIGKNGRVIETANLVNGNEWGNRRRAYSRKAPSQYPKDIVWLLETKKGELHCVLIPNAKKRYD